MTHKELRKEKKIYQNIQYKPNNQDSMKPNNNIFFKKSKQLKKYAETW